MVFDEDVFDPIFIQYIINTGRIENATNTTETRQPW
jgi:hypothetical protein